MPYPSRRTFRGLQVLLLPAPWCNPVSNISGYYWDPSTCDNIRQEPTRYTSSLRPWVPKGELIRDGYFLTGTWIRFLILAHVCSMLVFFIDKSSFLTRSFLICRSHFSPISKGIFSIFEKFGARILHSWLLNTGPIRYRLNFVSPIYVSVRSDAPVCTRVYTSLSGFRRYDIWCDIISTHHIAMIMRCASLRPCFLASSPIFRLIYHNLICNKHGNDETCPSHTIWSTHLSPLLHSYHRLNNQCFSAPNFTVILKTRVFHTADCCYSALVAVDRRYPRTSKHVCNFPRQIESGRGRNYKL